VSTFFYGFVIEIKKGYIVIEDERSKQKCKKLRFKFLAREERTKEFADGLIKRDGRLCRSGNGRREKNRISKIVCLNSCTIEVRTYKNV